MKLRIHGDSLRLRLTRPEVVEFAASGSVGSKVRFGGGAILHYALTSTEVPEVTARFTGDRVIVEVPHVVAQRWTGSEEVTITGSTLLPDGMRLDIVVEKDFQCLHRGEDAKDPDAYPNPMA